MLGTSIKIAPGRRPVLEEENSDASYIQVCQALSSAETGEELSQALKILNNTFLPVKKHGHDIFELFLEHGLFEKIMACLASSDAVVSSRARVCLITFTRNVYFVQFFVENGLFAALTHFLQSGDPELVIDASEILANVIYLSDIYWKRVVMILEEPLVMALLGIENPGVTSAVTRLIAHVMKAMVSASREIPKMLRIVSNILKSATGDDVIDNMLFGFSSFVKSKAFVSDLPELGVIMHQLPNLSMHPSPRVHVGVLRAIGRLYEELISTCVPLEWIIAMTKSEHPDARKMAFWALSQGVNKGMISVHAAEIIQLVIELCERGDDERDLFTAEYEIAFFVMSVLYPNKGRISDEVVAQFVERNLMKCLVEFITIEDPDMVKKALEVMIRAVTLTPDNDRVLEIYSQESVIATLHEIANNEDNDCKNLAPVILHFVETYQQTHQEEAAVEDDV